MQRRLRGAASAAAARLEGVKLTAGSDLAAPSGAGEVLLAPVWDGPRPSLDANGQISQARRAREGDKAGANAAARVGLVPGKKLAVVEAYFLDSD